jgi:nucleoside-diphosphate-sugar epimerase
MNQITPELIGSKLSDQRIMLVGGAGFIGHNLALHLARYGAEVVIVDNLMVNSLIENVYTENENQTQQQAYQNFLMERYERLKGAGIILRNGDARRFDDLTMLFDEYEPTKVVHLAAIASAVEARKDPGLAFDLQLITLRNVLEICRRSHSQVNQLMFLSSSTVYGDFEEASVDESIRPRPRGIYANAKYMGERLVRTYCHSYGLGTCIIRPSALYGERCISRRVSQVFIENALVGKPLLLEGGGDGRLDFTYIQDLTEGMCRALALHKGPGRSDTYNLTYGHARTIAELAAVVKSVVPNAILEERPRQMEKPIRGTLESKLAETELGFKPEWNLERGYRQYCEWYVEQWDRAKADLQRN